MGQGDTSRFYNFFGKEGLAGGLNLTDNPAIVSPQQMVECRNITISQTLSRKKRPGQVAYHLGSGDGLSGDPIRGIIQYYRFASSNGEALQDIVLHQADNVYSIEDRLSAAVDRTGAEVISSTGTPRYQIFEGILYFCNSDIADGYKKWNGLAEPEGNIEDAVPPDDGAGTLLGTWQGRMVMAGNVDFPFRVYVSAPYDPEDWQSANGATSFDLTYDGESGGITAIFPERDGLLFVATNRSIYQLAATDPNDVTTWALSRVTRGVGCVGQGTVVATPNDVLFCSTRGLHSLRKIIVSDQSDITFLSRDVQRVFTSMLNPLLLFRAQAIWDERENLYILTVASDGQLTQDLVLCYNITFDVWFIWDGIDARSLALLELEGRNYMMAGREDGEVTYVDPDQTADLDAGFACTFKTGKFFPNGDITHENQFVSVTALITTLQPSSVDISWTIDSIDGQQNGSKGVSVGESESLLGSTFILGASTLGIGRFIPLRVTVGQTGYNFQLQISASGESGLEFHGWVLEVEDAGTQYV
jgi:hypothetical protein